MVGSCIRRNRRFDGDRAGKTNWENIARDSALEVVHTPVGHWGVDHVFEVDIDVQGGWQVGLPRA